jgi:hypothetical protein
MFFSISFCVNHFFNFKDGVFFRSSAGYFVVDEFLRR